MDTLSRKRIVAGDTATAAAVEAATRSKVADRIGTGAYSSTREDTFGEAEAMAADEGRSSPPSPPTERSLGYHRRRRGQKQAPSLPQSSIGERNTQKRSSSDAPSCGPRAQQHGSYGHRAAAAAAASGSLFISSHGGGSLSPTAPAYEPSLVNNCTSSTKIMPWTYEPEASQDEILGEGVETTQRQRHFRTAASGKDDNLHHVVETNGVSRVSNTTSASTPAETHCEDAKVKLDTEVEDDNLQQQNQGQEPSVSSQGGGKLPSSTVDRKDFLSTMKKSGDKYQNVRQDLLQYMEGVRARCASVSYFVGLDLFLVTKCPVAHGDVESNAATLV